MWRFIILAMLGLFLGSKARSERQIMVLALLFGLTYGAAEVLAHAAITGPPSTARVLLLLGLGVVMAAPIYAIAELWRRFDIKASAWLRRKLKR